ncbi:hypothetical protein R5R35_009240 [Gryllus longicercus]|uniref:Presequence protease, mitochondrial n=1 Tax=Gryllus longicercus TaxID=2509291 RepID=A0AAN9VJZ9_9ORTH
MWGSRSTQFRSLWAQRFASGHKALFSRSTYSTAPTTGKTDFREGTEIEGFVVQQQEEVPEFNIKAIRLTHSLTGADYLHLLRNDNNNAFCVGFRTTPFDSTGLPHILEHTTLCGSVGYPCRDPFFKMLNRSMATFMNALTGPDYTMYPFATQNARDYKNLMSVYLDAVFKPRLREIDFRQEGWRLEHEEVTNAKSPIIFKGVVFNEMKGVFSDPQSVFGQALLNTILPSHTYGYVSGGDPKKIPLLTYKDLKAFHKRYYNPNNSRFYSYGNFPLDDHLKYINENYLSNVDVKEFPDSNSLKVPLEKRWSSPQQKNISCRFDPMAANPKKQSTIAISVLLDDIRNLESGFDWNILSELLVSGPNSSFYKALVEPQIGAGFSPSTGFESQTRDTFFSVGLQGVAQDDFGRVVEIYDKTVDDIIQKGFEPSLVDAVLHGIELSIKHEVSNFGLGMLFALNPLWLHGGDLMKALRVNDQLINFKEQMQKNPRHLQEIVERQLKGNAHKLILTMSPDEGYEERLMEQEKELLNSKLLELSKEDKKELFAKGLQLAAEQALQHDASCLPTLRVNDLNKDVEVTSLKDVTIKSVPLQCSAQPTNGIVYFRGILNASHLNAEQKSLLPLFANVVAKMGTKKHSYREMDQRINLSTGGISFTPHLRENLSDPSTHEQGLLFSSYALDRNIEELFNILSEIFNELSLDDLKRFETLTRMSAVHLANNIIDRGHLYAMLTADSLVSGSASLKETFAGMTNVDTIRRIAQLEDLSGVLDQLKSMANLLLNKKHLRCAVNYTELSESNVLKSTESFLSTLPGEACESSVFCAVPKVECNHNAVHHVLPIPVNFAAKALQTVSYTHKDNAPLTILAKLLSSKYLHPTIREKGGAYGSGAVLSMSGTFSYYSYRDPNSSVTLDVFDGSYKWLSEGMFSDGDIEEAKLGVFQKVDSPVAPGRKGMDRFLNGVSDSILQTRRRNLMAVTKEDVLTVAKKYLSDDCGLNCGRALLGPINTDLQKARKEESWFVKSHEA